MKLASLLRCIALCSAVAGAQERRTPARTTLTSDARLDAVVSLDFKSVPLPDALEEVARAGRIRISFSRETLAGAKPVTMKNRAVSVGAALAELLAGSSVGISVTESGLVVLIPREQLPSTVLHGRIRDATSGAPLQGVTLSLDGKPIAETDASGIFSGSVSDPVSGRALIARRVGYVAKAVVAGDDRDVAIDLALEQTPVTIDRVVVTAPADGLPERSVTSAIKVIGARDLERQRFARLEDVLRYNIPGLVIWNEGASSPTARFGSIRGASSFAINYLKTYIDGVEVATPYLALNLDPATIERVEVIRGPQGAALYGSEAINGVVQIVTRHGGGSARAPVHGAAAAAGGRLGSRYVKTPADLNEYSAEIGGSSNIVSFYTAGTGAHVGEYAPGNHSEARSLFGALRLAAGQFSAEGSAHAAKNRGGTGLSPVFAEHQLPVHTPPGADEHVTDAFYGVTLRYLPLSWVNARTSVGMDRSDLSAIAEPLPFANPADSFLIASSGITNRSTLHFSIDFQPGDFKGLTPTLSLGADGSRVNTVPNKKLSRNPLPSGRRASNGIFAQSTIGFGDSFYLNGGLRGERSSAFGARYGTALLPLAGVTFIHDGRPVTVKLRVAYGRGIRPPPLGAATGYSTTEIQQLANANLAPESQRGVEGGVDFYFAQATELHLTAYRQTAYDLVQQVIVNAASTPRIVQQQNVGTIANTGWEAEGSHHFGEVMLSAGYTAAESRVRAIARRYSGILQPGDRILEVPSWSANGGASLTHSRFSASVSFIRVGDWVNYDWISMYRAAFGKEPKKGTQRAYWITYPGFGELRGTAAIRILEKTELYLRAENITNEQRAGRDNIHVAPGRAIVAGLRIGS